MNENLAKAIKLYATAKHSAVQQYLAALSRDSVGAVLLDLLTMYFNDKNSSTLREYMLVTLSGFEPLETKIGYNGFRQITIAGEQVREVCEAKPKNINTNDLKAKKLNGAGGFNDYTFARLEKHKRENPTVLMGGFVDGKLIYICRFPFDTPSFTERMKEELFLEFPDGEDQSGKYRRSATFRLRDYADASDLVFVNEAFDEYKQHLTGPLHAFLENHLQNQQNAGSE